MREATKWLAHITEDGREQTLLEHLTGTAALCQRFAADFDAQAEGYRIGMMHDIGKYTQAFRRRLQGGPVVDHATAGAFECIQTNDFPAAFCISGHHGGLPDGGGRGDQDKGTLYGRMNKANEGKLEDYSAWKTECSLPEAGLPCFYRKDYVTAAFFTRMLYSCLVDADFLDTERFMEGKEVERGGGDSMEQLNQKFDRYIAGWFPPNNELNRCRCEILQHCMDMGMEQNLGLFTLTVPTGGGKTVASLAFALRHARRHRLKRIIYVIPYTSIIEQTAGTFRSILGNENVLEHHSGVLFDTNARGELDAEGMRKMRATENWDMPIVVTTAVQFFESLYANRASKCRKLHNLAHSVVIFDEAQMLSLPYLKPCVSAIAQLVEHYHVSAVLCTATQPALEPLFQIYLSTYQSMELCPNGMYENSMFQRVQFQRKGTLSWEDVAASMNQNQQVLCIVNSRKNAQTVFEKLEGEGCFHLSTLMYPAHRRAVLNEIRRRLDPKNPLPCRVVSTSLIEAGVDVDFPVVYREMAGLDSVLQAAGRCNREGKRPLEDSVVTIFRPESVPPPLFKTAIGASETVMEEHADIFSQAAIAHYFREWRDLKGDAAQDTKRILKQWQEDFFPFETVARQFKLIENDTCTIFIPLGKGAALLHQLHRGVWSRNLFRQLGQYSVSVYRQHAEALLQAGDIQEIENLDDTFELINLDLYAEETGLSLEADFGKALFV